MRILDIDLDFFLDKKCTTSTVTDIERLDGESYKPWKETEVRELMEENFRLSIHDKVPGIFCIHHDEVFYHLQQLQEKNEFALTFDIDHLDAHADLGLGDSSYRYIAETILTIPVHERAYPKKTNGWSGLSAGNYLCFAIACRWVSSLTYINRMDWIDDVPWFIFRDFTVGDHIQLKQFSSDQLEQMIYNMKIDMQQQVREMTPVTVEPAVSFQSRDYRTFINNGTYDIIFLTQSPGYTPASADILIPVIQSYMNKQTANV